MDALANFTTQLENFIDLVKADYALSKPIREELKSKAYREAECDDADIAASDRETRRRTENQEEENQLRKLRNQNADLIAELETMKALQRVLESKIAALEQNRLSMIAGYEDQFARLTMPNFGHADTEAKKTPAQQLAVHCGTQIEKHTSQLAELEESSSRVLQESLVAKEESKTALEAVRKCSAQIKSQNEVIKSMTHTLRNVREERNSLLAERDNLKFEAMTASVTLKTVLP